MNLIKSNEWKALALHQKDLATQHMREWFAKENERFAQFSLYTGDIFLDYSRNRITSTTLDLLLALAQAVDVKGKITALWRGDSLNTTEHRPALHTALRDKNHTPILVQGKNIALDITQALEKMQRFVADIHSKTYKGVTGKAIKHIVNIGIGGSYTGSMMCIHALRDYAITDLDFHFMTSVDHDHVHEIFQALDPETTLFIVSSKSLSTLETITNAHTALAWMKTKLRQHPSILQQHFIAVTAEKERALALGIPAQNIFPVWDWVGGRYSIWSAMGLPLMLMIGHEQFDDFLDGAYQMDQHFRLTDFSQNMPVILALLAIWYRNFFDAQTQAIVPYTYRLRYLIPYLQQAEMESNGKCINLQGEAITYATSPVLFGEEGCLGQHAYHQLLHQGQHLIPVDFIFAGQASNHSPHPHQDIILASGLSQAEALMRGKTYEEAKLNLIAKGYTEEQAATLAKHQIVPGNKPSNILFIKRLRPQSLGALLALYEHKIFVQSVIWNINPFDQWGIELGKQLLPDILPHVSNYPHKMG